MNKNQFATTPPMGWNSYDYYDTTVTEDDIKANADYMAKHLKQFGWEYVVVDIEWYAYNTGTKRDKYQYIPFEKVELDQYSRLLPCPDRFPSSVNGMGFAPLADYVHSLGLKFGIHIMRGIPRAAAHTHTAILGTSRTANEIADPASICFWNPDMYGIDPKCEGSQEYYNSIFELYAKWGVDFVKCDDICRMDMSSAKEETIMLHKAIMKCGRPIVLSLSPGPAKIEEAWHYKTYSNMWRITDDLWDTWPLVLAMFDRCELWQDHVSTGCYPDCDMLPLGIVGKGFGDERFTRLTKDEQYTMMTLWCIFGSPLMLGCELTKLDDFTLSLITNDKILNLLTSTNGGKQLAKDEYSAIWYASSKDMTCFYLAIFNFNEDVLAFSFDIKVFPFTTLPEFDQSTLHNYTITDLWTNDIIKTNIASCVNLNIASHGVKLLQFQKKNP